MSLDGNGDPKLQVERVGEARRGIGWKTSLLAVGAIVLGIAGVAVAGRPTPPTSSDLPSAAAAGASTESPASVAEIDAASETPSARQTPWATRKPVGEALPETEINNITFGADAYAVIAHIDGRLYTEVLQEYRPGRFRGSFRVPFPADPAGRYTFEFAQLWTRDRSRQSLVVVDSWSVRLAGLEPDTTRSASLIREVVSGRPRQSDAPRAVRRGYAITVGAESRYNFGVIWIDVSFATGRDPAASVVYRNWPLRQRQDDLAVLDHGVVNL